MQRFFCWSSYIFCFSSGWKCENAMQKTGFLRLPYKGHRTGFHHLLFRCANLGVMDFPHIYALGGRFPLNGAVPTHFRTVRLENQFSCACEYREFIIHHIIHSRKKDFVFAIIVRSEAAGHKEVKDRLQRV